MKTKIFYVSLILLDFALTIAAQSKAKMFSGYVNGQSVQMTLTRDSNKLSGTYFYTKYGTKLNLNGTIDDAGNFKLIETDQKGTKTGEFTGKWNEDANKSGVNLEGDWKKPKSADALGFAANEQMIDFTGNAKLTTKTFSETNKIKKFEMSAEYPEISGIDPTIAGKFNQLVKAKVMKDLAAFKKTMMAQTAEDLKVSAERNE